MPKLANTFTVRQVARRRDISVRQVNRDIAAGKLSVIHATNGRVYVTRSAFESYRSSTATIANNDRMSVEKAAEVLGISLRQLKRRIASGHYRSAKIGGRRWVSARNVKADVRARSIGMAEWETKAEPQWQKNITGLLKDLDRAIRFAVARLAQRVFLDMDVGVSKVAVYSGRAPREVYHHIEKGVLKSHRDKHGRIRIRLLEAFLYVDDESEQAWMVEDTALWAASYRERWLKDKDGLKVKPYGWDSSVTDDRIALGLIEWFGRQKK